MSRRAAALLRILFVVAGLTLGLHGARAFAGCGEQCVQGCDDDTPDGKCPPDCGDCVCCAHQAPLVAETFTLVAPSSDRARRFHSDRNEAPASADPREVQHVPKSLLG